MSATIPNGMLLSDLLKATGYDCPDDLQGKSFSQATSGGQADLEANHASTVDVGEYTQPIEITPAEGKDGMEKVTLTLTNIPSEADIEANKEATIDVSAYTEPVEITPTAGKDGMAKATVTLTNIPSGGSAVAYAWKDEQDATHIYYTNFAIAPEALTGNEKGLDINDGVVTVEEFTETGYTKISDTSFSALGGIATFARDSSKDFTLWQA